MSLVHSDPVVVLVVVEVSVAVEDLEIAEVVEAAGEEVEVVVVAAAASSAVVGGILEADQGGGEAKMEVEVVQGEAIQGKQ